MSLLRRFPNILYYLIIYETISIHQIENMEYAVEKNEKLLFRYMTKNRHCFLHISDVDTSKSKLILSKNGYLSSQLNPEIVPNQEVDFFRYKLTCICACIHFQKLN